MLLNDDNSFSIYSIKIEKSAKYLIVAQRDGHKDPISGNRSGSTLFDYNEFIITGNSNPPMISNNNNKERNSNIKFDKKFIHINSNTNNE
ncbi:unnamed protein product [Rotaria sordida]|uniref:Uncharacterized protein n=1 Tax=Rotaria sordida TaxID=392033 RepID=A0A820DRQ4_9BILA|nr:unnamed protein product [Rotaria sordida]